MEKKTRLFGTDGIRGTANQYPMTPDMVVKIGQAIGYLLRKEAEEKSSSVRKVVIGKDTRLSGYMIEQALASGLNSMGVFVQLVGPLPTPGIGYLTRTMRAAAGIVISASHNPFHDNGIKVFGSDGFKISEEMEREIERLVLEEDLTPLLPPSKEIGRTRRIEDSQGRYIVYVKGTFPLEYTLDGMRIVLDTANGASYKVAPSIFQELGAEVIQLGDDPNGTNINDKVGALYPQKLAESVLHYRADVGISLDGDADRVIMVDEKGEIVNGDRILAICALHMKERGLLKGDTLVATQMSNFGLEKRMNEAGIKLVKTGVGDKYVVEEMRKHGYNLGGEQSGHIIFLDHTTTGDGCIAALSVLAVMKQTGKKMSDLNHVFEDVPQILINCRVKRRAELSELAGYNDMIRNIEKKLAGNGRVFVRFSGTEPVIRVLVEGTEKAQITQFAEEIASFLEKELS
ncbi:phosphoglucosamine mutase [Bdellovibrio bacteriovorus]|uniref:Phosphoglucosamine mutase n=1 Tax=Bdellovibrio bacteriovorus (strain ATCC 15356 / DSM 50701 / NCIMB 9529 / HD100) TaxID=264462 RepID=GLMM_BDEBA|nr:phosphoglucosamine mutase [Bdellovibrio bacteriovorus]Q6MLS4.1 RecName: Full=Phosphoglucosamine mutase [Bdellovibrio bacteriovorus HD100]AHZ84429.1 phosphoglucosamine mutase [Bdellovibrio bacteriovorus]CAE79782.1 phosphoglucosamine mutase [Bdellovibrio bacteriovorus HD100]